MRSAASRRWIIVGIVALTAMGVGIALIAYNRATPPRQYLCWDTPSTGQPAKYLVTFDGGSPLELTSDCVRVPAELHTGTHTVVVRAVDAFGQASPPTSLQFVVP